MKSCIAIVWGALAAALLTATTLTGGAAQEGSANSTSVKRVERFTPLTAMRIKPLESSKWTDAHREALGPGGGSTQVQICLHNLDLCRKFWTFVNQITGHYTLPLRDKELLTLRTAWLSRGDFVWGSRFRARRVLLRPGVVHDEKSRGHRMQCGRCGFPRLVTRRA